jgi:hypothetical protein
VARIRNLKPAFFKDEDLAELLPLTRLLFAGLWTLADKAGNLEDRPRFIKIEVLPYDDCVIADELEALLLRGFIRRYEVDGRAYIHIPTFTKHQRISGDEARAEPSIPPPPEAGKKQRRSTPEACPTHESVRSTEIGVLVTDDGRRTTDTAPVARLVSSSSTAHGMGREHLAGLELVAAWNRIRPAPPVDFGELQAPSRRQIRDALRAKGLAAWERIFKRIEPSDYLAGRLDMPVVSLFKALELGDHIDAGQYDNRRPTRAAGLSGGGQSARTSGTVTVTDPDYNGAPYRFPCSHTPPCATWPQCRDHDQAARTA